MKIICVGKKHEKIYSDAIEHFVGRIRGNVEWVIIPPSGKSGSEATKEESDKLLHRLQTEDFVVLCDENGSLLSSSDIAKLIEKSRVNSKQFAVVIGGAYGVDERLKNRADSTLSFGRVVFPHQLMRVMVLEQLYRAESILGGSGYHHD